MTPITPTDSQSTLSESDVEGSWLRDVVARVVACSLVAITDHVALETEATLGVLALVRQELAHPSSKGGHKSIDEYTQAERLRRREEELVWREEELEWRVKHAERREVHARMRDENAQSRDDESRRRDEDVRRRESEFVLRESDLAAREATLEVQEDTAGSDKLRCAEETEQRVQDHSGEIAEREVALAEREAAVRTAEEEIVKQRETARAEEARARDVMAAAERILRETNQLCTASGRWQKALEENELEVVLKTVGAQQGELEAAYREQSVLTRQAEAAQREEVLIRRQREVAGREEKALHREIAVAVREAEALREDAVAEKAADVREPAGADAADPQGIEGWIPDGMADVVVVDADDNSEEVAQAALESDATIESAPSPTSPAEDGGTVKVSVDSLSWSLARMRGENFRTCEDEYKQRDQELQKRERDVLLKEDDMAARQAMLKVQEDTARNKLRRAEEAEKPARNCGEEIAEREATLVDVIRKEMMGQREDAKAVEANAREVMATAVRMLKDAEELLEAAQQRQNVLEEREESLMHQEMAVAVRADQTLRREAAVSISESLVGREAASLKSLTDRGGSGGAGSAAQSFNVGTHLRWIDSKFVPSCPDDRTGFPNELTPSLNVNAKKGMRPIDSKTPTPQEKLELQMFTTACEKRGTKHHAPHQGTVLQLMGDAIYGREFSSNLTERQLDEFDKSCKSIMYRKRLMQRLKKEMSRRQ
ncbi:hypothetical protein FA95DRAFT_989123 [Auriscalpium vulgare]|uniref:Uncharacterized protein n=1 Tax=Auriscalpium vulgare TaxID=40419 RepID=A0ACB8RXH1_9AGAM|nr:hypothetical protein FA95DRAFT_989123 [Auriscalpium vulgare]